MFATVLLPSPSLLVRGGLRSVAAGRVLVRGEHSRDVQDAQAKKLASRTTLCAELAAGARACLRQPLNRGRLRTNVSLDRRRFTGASWIRSDTAVRACDLARHTLISRSRLVTDLPSLSLFSQRYRGWWFEFNFGRRRLSPCTRRRTIPRILHAGFSSRTRRCATPCACVHQNSPAQHNGSMSAAAWPRAGECQ